MAIDKDYYQTLGVDGDASRQEIRHAYHQLVRRYHPDSGGEMADHELFLLVQEAYEVLGSQERRRAYDRWRAREGLDRPPSLRLEVTPSHEVLQAIDEPQLLYLYAQELPGSKVRTEPLSLSLCLVLDHSTSMQGEKLAQLKEATFTLIDALDERDILSLVTFSDRAATIISAFHGSDKAAMKAAVAKITASGGTEIYQGLRMGLDLVRRQRPERSLEHMILLTDGQTYGDEELCVELAREAARAQVRITALGLGTDWNDVLLDEIAKQSNGDAAYIESPQEIAAIFQRRIQSLQGTFARNARFVLRHTQDISLKEVFQVLPTVRRLEGRGGEIHIGDLGMEAPAAFLLSWQLAPHPVGIHQLATLTVEGDIPALELQGEKAERQISVRFSESADPSRAPVPEVITKAMEHISAVRLEEKAAQDLANGRPLDASQRLEHLATRLLSLGERQLAREALLEARRVTATGQLSPLGKKRLKYGTRSLAHHDKTSQQP